MFVIFIQKVIGWNLGHDISYIDLSFQFIIPLPSDAT
jgi:hypothetical protein